MKEFTYHEIRTILEQGHWQTVNKWLERGDGIAVYYNAAMDSSQLGHRQFLSYGSRAAQIDACDPPQKMPDIGSQINWAYQLEGIYWGQKLEHNKECTTRNNQVGETVKCTCLVREAHVAVE